MLTIIHGADFHLDSPFSGLSPAKASQRRREQRDLLAKLVTVATERRADLVLLAGDLFDGAHIYRETASRLAEELGRLPCPVVIAPGNHDFYSARSPYATISFPENVHIFTENSVKSIDFAELNCVVHGAAFLDSHADCSPLHGFVAPDDGKIHLMALHGALDGTDYAPIDVADIAASKLHYLALGHVHQKSPLLRAGDSHYAYSGCPEGRGFDELGDRGVLLVSIDGGQVKAEEIPLATRKYQVLTVDLTGVDNPVDSVECSLPTDCAGDCYRIVLSGVLGEGCSLKGLRERLEPRFFSLDIRDNTRPATPIWARLDEDSLAGLFLREMAREGDERDPDLVLAVRYGLSALEQGEDIAP